MGTASSANSNLSMAPDQTWYSTPGGTLPGAIATLSTTPPPAAATGGGGGGAPAPAGGGTVLPALNTGAIKNTQLTLDQLPAILQAALASEAQTHSNTVNGFNAQQDQQQKTYDGSSTINQQNYDSNFMDSIRAGIKGIGGLINILRGNGAGGGTAEDQVRDAVGGVTANDIRTGQDTHQTNQNNLDSSLSTFLTDLKGKRQAAEDTFTNNNSAINRDSSTQMQDLMGKMAGYYGAARRTAEANDWMARAGALTPTIAANTRTAVSNYDTTPVVAQAPKIAAFAPPSQPQSAIIPQDGQVGSGIFAMNKARKDDSATPVPVGA